MRPFPRALAVVVLLTACGLAACGGEQHWSADASWSNEKKEETQPLRETEALNAPAPLTEADAGTSALLGVRHDVMIAPSAKHDATCACLAVAVGGAGDPTFQWSDGVPEVGDALVIAVSAKVAACPGGDADPARRRASISAVDRDGSDVLVEIEELPEGRPIASGAIIPNPGPGGAVYVRARSARLPYAGATRCKVH